MARTIAPYACTSLALTKPKGLAIALGQRPLFHSRLLPLKGARVMGWGRKWSGRRAQQIAQDHDVPVLLVEDGFLRSIDRLDPCLSYLFDEKGVSYDARHPSTLEDLAREPLEAKELARTRALIGKWRATRVSKYNNQPDIGGELDTPYVLVIDQTWGDASIAYGLADADSFQRMLDAALAHHPDHKIFLKTHPDVMTRGKKGHFDITALGANDRIRVITDPLHPVRLLEQAAAVYTVTSQVGFEALLWGKPVHTFGMPFYAGWGLTEDALPTPERRQRVTLEQFVHAALVKYPRYIDPVGQCRCEVERAMDHIGLQRRTRLAFPARIKALGFSRWKRPFIRDFLQGSHVSFAKPSAYEANPGDSGAVVVWGSNRAPKTPRGVPVLRIEDGFLRSSGLGADLVRPLSLVIDDIGIYYDATGPSRLEQILQEHVLDPDQTDRARRLRETIIRLDVTKYNLGRTPPKRPDTDKPVLLVVGQVETDASIRLGSPEVTTNLELLKRVRQAHPEAYIIYKPHPDVVAGLRKRGAGEAEADGIADEVMAHPVSIGQLLAQVDAVHTMTSLLGFEALIRGVQVVCHGLPFYAGWGLTQDRLASPRRTRQVTIDELVHGALIAYPRYFDHEAKCFVTPEHALEQLAIWSRNGPSTRSWYRKVLRAIIVFWLTLKGSTR